ncbi:hypothetical protein IKX64_00085 [Candidatus Saccharibacteria bacterium]|nr:hypothetical protein [Candidatus Saccharibacteria bacterium]
MSNICGDTEGDCKKNVFAVAQDCEWALMKEQIKQELEASREAELAKHPSYTKTVLENGDTVFAGWFGIMVFDKKGRPKLRGSSDGRFVEKFGKKDRRN